MNLKIWPSIFNTQEGSKVDPDQNGQESPNYSISIRDWNRKRQEEKYSGEFSDVVTYTGIVEHCWYNCPSPRWGTLEKERKHFLDSIIRALGHPVRLPPRIHCSTVQTFLKAERWTIAVPFKYLWSQNYLPLYFLLRENFPRNFEPNLYSLFGCV